MNYIDETNDPPRKGRKHSSPASSSPQATRPERFAFTVDANTGEVIQIEGIDAAGARHELSKDEKADLAKDNGHVRLEELLEQAFEAGIACVLGGEEGPEEAKEAKKDAELRHILLKPLIEESAAARLMRRDVLDRAIIETLIQHSLKSRSKESEGGPRKDPNSNHAGPRAT